MECLWFCFADIIQQDLDHVKDFWNSHYIRSSRHETVSGRPNELFFLPEMDGAENYLHPISELQCQHVEENHAAEAEASEYPEYFIYVKEQCELNQPQTWREALYLYNQLIFYSNRH